MARLDFLPALPLRCTDAPNANWRPIGLRELPLNRTMPVQFYVVFVLVWPLAICSCARSTDIFAEEWIVRNSKLPFSKTIDVSPNLPIQECSPVQSEIYV